MNETVKKSGTEPDSRIKNDSASENQNQKFSYSNETGNFFELIFSANPFPICRISSDHIIISCNKSYGDFYEYPVHKLIGKNLQETVTASSLVQYKECFKKAVKLIPSHEIIQVQKPNGKYADIIRYFVPYKNKNDEFEGAFVFDYDITESINTEEMLGLIGNALNAAANSIVITNIRGEVLLVNPAFSRLTGFLADEIIYKNLRILKSGKQDTEFYQKMWDTILSGEVWHGEIINKRKDSTHYIQEQTITPVFNKNNELTYFIAVQQDVTEKKEAERQARIHHEQIIQADKMIALGTLVSGVAHEINNPNNFVMLNVPILNKIWQSVLPILDEHFEKHGDFNVGNRLKYSKVRESVPVLLSGIAEGSQRIKRIVQDLKDFARKESSEHNQSVNINEVIKASVNLTSNLINKSTYNFTTELDESVPETWGSFQKLEQVIINLIENSCQALTDKNKAIRVISVYEKEKKRIKIIVEDEGIGIDPAIIKEITDPFFTTKRDIGGTGLGLSVSSKIVINHGGSLDFESSPGIGTKAIVSLPLKQKTL